MVDSNPPSGNIPWATGAPQFEEFFLPFKLREFPNIPNCMGERKD